MNSKGTNPFSAGASLAGYIFQVRYALLESLRRLRNQNSFRVSIETLDDVVFERDGSATELLQTKHHLNRTANLTDASPDLWKSLRIWSEGLASQAIPDDSTYFLITTAQTSPGSATHFLRAGTARNVNAAHQRLNSTVQSSTNAANRVAYDAFRALSSEQALRLLQSVYIIDSAPDIRELEGAIREVMFYAAENRFLDALIQRMEGWWLRRVIKHIAAEEPDRILSEELAAETTRLREQFKQDNLPIDDDIMDASVNASGYHDRAFVAQLKLIEIGNPRILHAIRNYFRAFVQRSRWLREELLLVGEIGRYEDRLAEEWDLHFQRMREELGSEATEVAKKDAAQTLYSWVETNLHPPIRPNVTEASIARGSYQILADEIRVGWHVNFKERLHVLLESRKESP